MPEPERRAGDMIRKGSNGVEESDLRPHGLFHSRSARVRRGRRWGGPAQLNLYDTPAEARWAPFFDNMPACDDGGVLSTISGRFFGTQREFWNSNLSISGFDRIREIGFRSNGLSYIPRRYCVARAAMSDRKERTVVYAVGTQLGIIGVTWGVEWCVVGIDPTFAYAPDCEVIRPILEREIGKAKWLAEYGLKAHY